MYFFSIFRLIHSGQLLNGLAGPTLMSAGPLLSTTWFAPDQRATATAVASLVGYLGAACSFLIGPLAVPAPNDTHTVNSFTQWDPEHIRDRIQYVLYAGTVLSPYKTFSTSMTTFSVAKSSLVPEPNIKLKDLNNIRLHLHLKERTPLSCLTDSEN